MQEGALLAVPEVTTHQIVPTNGLAFLVLGTDGLWEGVAESKVCERELRGVIYFF